MVSRTYIMYFLSGGLIALLSIVALLYFYGEGGVVMEVEETVEVNGKSGTESGLWLDEVFTDLSRYEPGHSVQLTAELTNRKEVAVSGQVVFTMFHLSKQVSEIRLDTVKLEGGESKSVTVEWLPPAEDYQGYLVEARLIVDKEVMDQKNTAVDVSSDWGKFPRYGYLANFGNLDQQLIDENIDRLNGYHINGLQFYDWQYKHHQPLPDTINQQGSVWKDIANRDVYIDTVRQYIYQAHEKNMMAMNYNLLFGSYMDAQQDGVSPQWGLFKDSDHKAQDGHPLPSSWATNRIMLQNPLNSDWQNYLFREEKKVFAVLPFDGFHVDQLGDRGRLYDWDGNVVDLLRTYAPFLDAAKEQLNTRFVMNAVNQYGQSEIVKAPVDFLYTEVWPSSGSSYEQLKTAIDIGRNLTNGSKNMVLAAYMNYQKAEHPGEFNTPSVLLTNAVIFAAGGSHIELGDTGMLGKEYFPNDNLKMTDELDRALKDYYHFLVAYQNLLRDGVTGAENLVNIIGTKVFDRPLPGSVWTFSRKKQGYEILQLINLSHNTKIHWRDDLGTYEQPDPLKGLLVKYYTDLNVGKVNWTSPDYNHGSSEQLSFERGSDEQGSFVEFTLPHLLYWDMVYFEEYQSENASK